MKTIAVWQVREALPDRQVLESSCRQLAKTMLLSAHRHASAVAAGPRAKQQRHE